jgi:hypothetical protein
MSCSLCWLPIYKEGLCRNCSKQRSTREFQEVLKQIERQEDVSPEIYSSFSSDQQVEILTLAARRKHPTRYHFSRTSSTWPHFLEKVKTHLPGDLCQAFRTILREGSYKEHIFPEECAGCALALYESNREIYLYPLLDSFIYYKKEYALFFNNHQEYGRQREELLSFVNEVLWIPREDMYMDVEDADEKRKHILKQLRLSSRAEDRLLQDLALRPENYALLLANPPILRECYLNLVYENPEDHWAFCARVREKLMRRIEIRCRLYKEELLEKTWNPDRAIAWCFSIDEQTNISLFR